MSEMRAFAAITRGALVALVACADPRFDVEVSYEQLGVAAASELAAQVSTLTVSVVDAVAAGPAAGLGRDATCDDVAFGRISAAVLEGARRASVSALDSPRLSGVPRLGAKLVIAEARSGGGTRIGGGCTPWGDVESDAVAAVRVEVAPRVRIFTRDEASSEPMPVQLVMTAPWDDLLPLAGRQVVAELHASAGVVEMAVEPTNLAGLTRTPDFSLDEPGPAQTLVRVRWADEPLRVPAFVLWPAMATTSGNRITLVSNDLSRIERSWVSGPAIIGGQTTWAAAAIQQRSPGAEEIVVAYFNPSTRKLAAVAIPAPGVRALALWDRSLYTIVDDGWHAIQATGLGPPIAGTADGSGAATELHVFDGCGTAPGAGLLVRRLIGTVETYRAYTAPGMPAPSSHPLAVIAPALDAGQEVVQGQLCATLDDAEVRIALSRGSAIGLIAWLSSGQRIVLPGVQGATDFQRNGKSLVAGVEATISGPRVTSYKLTTLAIGGVTLTGFVAVSGVETELATIPSSLAVVDLDQDDLFDVVASLPGITGVRVQVNLGREVAGQQLASISPILADARSGAPAIIQIEQVDGGGHSEMVVMSNDGLDVLCFDVKPGGAGMECASAP